MAEQDKLAVFVFTIHDNKATPLCEAFNVSSVNFFSTNSVKESLRFFAKTVADRLTTKPDQHKTTLTHEGYFINVLVSSGLILILVTKNGLPRLDFGCLSKIEQAVKTSGYKSDPTQPMAQLESSLTAILTMSDAADDKITKLQQQIDSNKEILIQNIDSVLERGERIDNLVCQSADLSVSAKSFYKKSSSLNSIGLGFSGFNWGSSTPNINALLPGVANIDGSVFAQEKSANQDAVDGLITEGGDVVRVKEVKVDANVLDMASSVNVTQTYINQYDTAIETKFSFPLNALAAVCKFTATIDGHDIVGVVQTKEEAEETYDDALAEGRTAALMQEEEPDVFVTSLGNIPPGAEVIIKITYVSELEVDGKDIKFVLPTSVAPRYAPPADLQTQTLPSISNVFFSIGLEMSCDITGVKCSDYTIDSTLEGTKGLVVMDGQKEENRVVLLNKKTDFALQVSLAEPNQPRVWLEHDKEHKSIAVMASFYPDLEVEEIVNEVVIVIDCSGSMSGSRINSARQALKELLDTIPSTCFVNVCRFGSSHKLLFRNSQPCNEKTKKAIRELQVEADLGGTELLKPLHAILSSKAKYPRQVFVMTDGEVSNTDQIIRYVRAKKGSTRIFSFGIGSGCSKELVSGIARAGNGKAEYISDNYALKQVVVRQVKLAVAPALIDMNMDWGAIKPDQQSPHVIPSLFSGSRQIVYAVMPDTVKFDETQVVLSVMCNGKENQFAIKASMSDIRENKMVHTLAVKNMITELLEGASRFHEESGALMAQYKTADKDFIKHRVEKLGVMYQLASKHTSFVAVDTREGTSTQTEMVQGKLAGDKKMPVTTWVQLGDNEPVSWLGRIKGIFFRN
mmetsp:Transcript_293/g.306  ORF Transcript_293/g.306 Transcript_293/m.306 type:complete len:853 (+) Transcript_293:33-2591(+)